MLDRTKCVCLAGWLVASWLAFGTQLCRAQAWRDAANARIETHRKSDLTVRVLNNLGAATSDAEVQVRMKQHSFRFGTAVQAGYLSHSTPSSEVYRTKLLENFNEVVFENDLKFPGWAYSGGSTGFPWQQTQLALDWLDSQSIPARGHSLAWATWSGPDAWGTSSDVSTLRQRLFDHITDKATAVGDRVYEWDAINHPVGWLGDTYENRLGPNIYRDLMQHARQVTPEGVALWINEDNVIAGNGRANAYEQDIQQLINAGAAPDGIGFQAHFIQEWGRTGNSTPQQVYDRIDRFADLSPRLRVTELDVDTGSNETAQAEYLRDYLTVMFSHESMEAVTMWGFWGGAHWRGENGALFRSDWSEKPSLTAYRDLVFDEWWTDETGETNAQGEFSTRAFDGEYEVVVNIAGQEHVVSDYTLTDNDTLQITLDVSTLPGDFNNDGTVDTADYTVWRDNLGAASGTLPNDFYGGGIGTGQYDLWQANFGSSAVSASLNALSVPEPNHGAVLLLLLMGWFGGRLKSPSAGQGA